VSRTVRDNLVGIVVGVIAALIAGLITVFTTDLTRLEDVGVFGLSLVVCGLVLALAYVPGMVSRRHERRRSALKAEIMAEVQGELGEKIALALEPWFTAAPADYPTPRIYTPGDFDSLLAAVRLAVKAPAVPTEKSLRELLIEGRDLQAKCRGIESSYVIPDELAVEIGQWDGRVGAALLDDTDLLDEFRSEPWAGEVFHLSAREAYKMLQVKLGALESAIRKNARGESRRS
jgi:hypothetical protein